MYEFRKKFRIIKNDVSKAHLLVVSEAFPNDSGNYTCVASNKLGESKRHFKVKVQPRTVAQEPKIIPGKPGNHTILVG